MKKIMKLSMLMMAVSLLTLSNSQAQEIVVRTRMHRTGPVFVRPARPSRHHVWVTEEWTPGGRTYVHHAGYWAVAPHARAVWIGGHWRLRHHGYVWIAGHWNR